jgi:eukaryotic-like serine/threonine-protein kinase
VTSPLDARDGSLDPELTQASQASAPPKETIGPYRLLQLVGEGGMGEVWLAEQTRPVHRQVALKVIKAGMDTAQVVARFEAERQALALMDHPAIARVFDAGATPQGRPYFVMEYVRGESITNYAARQQLSIRQRIDLFIQICEGVQHAHQKGIIHRDLKPSNILVTLQNDRPVPKIIDFGVAKAITHSLTERTLHTEFGALVGTPEYMSPEQAEMSGTDIDTRTDVYALGIVLYELLAGMLPFEAKSLREKGIDEVRRIIREVDPPKPSSKVTTSAEAAGRFAESADARRLASQLRGDLDWITMKALEKDRTRRYETVNGIARDLQRYLSGDPVEAYPPSSAYRLRKFVNKHRGWFAASAGFATLLIVAVVVSTLLTFRARRAEQEAIEERNISTAVTQFLRDDLLAQASAYQSGVRDLNPLDLTVRTALDRAASRINGKFANQPLVEASIRHTIGTSHWKLGLFADAETQLTSALDLRRRVLGMSHPDSLDTAANLGDVLTYQGKYPQAESLLADALGNSRAALGERHDITLMIMNNLALAYERAGRYEASVPLYAHVVEVRRQRNGMENAETLASAANLAVVYYRQGKYADAETILSDVLPRQRRLIGEDHPDTIITTNVLAMTFKAQGKLAEAERLLLRSVEASRRVLGEDHPDTLRRMNNLGLVYLAQRRFDEAEVLLKRSFDARSRSLGQEHPDTLITLNGLASLARMRHRYQEAEQLFERLIAARQRALGHDHPDTRASISELSEMQKESGYRR